MSVLEIGIGTNYTDIVSSMGITVNPGASLRAFRDYFKNAIIYGADIDRRILFSEERILTFFVDQLNPETFYDLDLQIPNEIDLIIDDGLHFPLANIETLNYGCRKIKAGGWIIIEDITLDTKPIWEIVATLLPQNFESYFVLAKNSNIFAVKRLI